VTERQGVRKLETVAQSASLRPADHAAVAAIERALLEARRAGDDQAPFAIIASALAEFDVAIPLRSRPPAVLVERGRDEWLRRLRSGGRSESALRAYRTAIDDLLGWAMRCGRGDELFEERAMVDHLDDYRQRVSPAAATYHRRFLILRRFMRWLSSREGVPDPFLDLEAPRKPRQESEWLTPAEFRLMLEAAGRPLRHHTGIVERDRLVLLALVTTGLRRSELINLDWRDLSLECPQPSLLVRHGKGDKARRQPLAPQLADELRQLQRRVDAPSTDPVFCGLAGGRLQPKVLAAIIKRAAERAGLEKRVTAHTLRHTAATWLRQETGDTRLVAEYLGHADLSTVSRYAHVAERELHEATAALGRLASAEVAEVHERQAA
jgi:site-specific recombinase XerD